MFFYKYFCVMKRWVIKVVVICWSMWFVFNVICRVLRVKNDEFFLFIVFVVIVVSFILNIILNFKIFEVVRFYKR